MEFRARVEDTCTAAEAFVNLYYEMVDKKRQMLIKQYQEKATLVWNGNVVSGQEAVKEFFEMLPPSEFQVTVFDCQPVHEQVTQGQTTMLIMTHGSVKLGAKERRKFNQNFLLTAEETPTWRVWRITSDCLRFQDWAS
ncbi:NTF2-related export protein 2 [Microcaecilia unicolor]|uniref:NTF2-related export protein n=1 Tax=Microcaecilia unicolor TaxID=1415580 RepID=A0A6P7YF88_9AMPH|nr:NTF2-related export protein 2 [Microcaecilia unicolor]